MNWTPELPKESGFYWYRHSSRDEPIVCEMDDTLETIWTCGSEIMRSKDSEYRKIDGEFWPVKLTPPN